MCGNASSDGRTIKKSKKVDNLVIETAVSSVGWWWGDAITEHNVLFLKLRGKLVGAYFVLSHRETKCILFVSEIDFAKKKAKS